MDDYDKELKNSNKNQQEADEEIAQMRKKLLKNMEKELSKLGTNKKKTKDKDEVLGEKFAKLLGGFLQKSDEAPKSKSKGKDSKKDKHRDEKRRRSSDKEKSKDKHRSSKDKDKKEKDSKEKDRDRSKDREASKRKEKLSHDKGRLEWGKPNRSEKEKHEKRSGKDKPERSRENDPRPEKERLENDRRSERKRRSSPGSLRTESKKKFVPATSSMSFEDRFGKETGTAEPPKSTFTPLNPRPSKALADVKVEMELGEELYRFLPKPKKPDPVVEKGPGLNKEVASALVRNALFDVKEGEEKTSEKVGI